MNEVYQVPSTECPTCHQELMYCTTAIGHTCKAPADGDLSLCTKCASLSIYEHGKLRDLTLDEMLSVQACKFWPQINAAIRRAELLRLIE